MNRTLGVASKLFRSYACANREPPVRGRPLPAQHLGFRQGSATKNDLVIHSAKLQKDSQATSSKLARSSLTRGGSTILHCLSGLGFNQHDAAIDSQL